MESVGFVKISRTVLDSHIWEDGYDAALYFFFLLRASYNFYGQLKPGQLRASVVSIAQALGWSRNGTAKHIESLSSKGLISVSRSSNGTLYTVINWNEICPERAQSTATLLTNAEANETDTNAHNMNATAHNMGNCCPQYEHNQKDNQKRPRTLSYREQAFEIFWKAYPRHEEKSAARKAWMEMDASVEELMEALEHAKESRDWLQENGRFIPKAAKWLDGKWVDYIDPSRREERTAWKEF